MVVCKVCGHENEAGAQWCGSCGSFLEYQGEPSTTGPGPTGTGPGLTGTGPGPTGTGPGSTGTGPGSTGTGPGPTGTGPGPTGTGPGPTGTGGGAGTGTGPTGTGGGAGTGAQTDEDPGLEGTQVIDVVPDPPPGGITCRACGTLNEADRTYCKKCATELVPAGAGVGGVGAGGGGASWHGETGTTTEIVMDEGSSRAPLFAIGGVAAIVVLAVVGIAVFGGTPVASPTPGPSATDGPVVTASPDPSISPSPSASVVVTPEPSVTPEATASPSGTIVFTSGSGASADIIALNVATGEFDAVIRRAGRDNDPSLSWDGLRVAYASGTGLRIVGLDGDGDRDFTHHEAADLNPAWSPDGSVIAFTSDRNRPNNRYEIYLRLADGDGSDLERLTTDRAATDFDATWSPDGARIAFVSDRSGQRKIWIMGRGGDGDAERLTDSGGREDDPAWSPDGSLIAFTSDRSGTKRAYVVSAEGGEPKLLVAGGPNVPEHDMAWSPDSRYIVIARGADDRELVIVDLEGDELDTYQQGGKTAGAPDWR